jgi:hypothetical protein
MLDDSWDNNMNMVDNLKNVQNGVTSWKFHTFDFVLRKKNEIMRRLDGIQRTMHMRNNVGGLQRLERKLQRELHDILKQEELMWYQRSRAQWLIDGDRNTKYYHLKTVQQRRKNNIVMLRDGEGRWVEESSQVHNMVTNYYKELFALNHTMSEWAQSATTYPVLDEVTLSRLSNDIEDDEVKHALFCMKPWKAPGPDGFPAGFYQKSWEVVGKSVCDFMRKVWDNPSELSLVNQTDICLIPKVEHPEFVNQFRPISLCNTIYKVVSKVIVERLKVCIPILVSPFQTGFVPGRSIHENIVVAQEMVHSMNKMTGQKGYFAIKVDLSKAYDKLSWDFIWRTLSEIQLPIKMINVIMHSVTSVETNVKWNGARSEYFRPQRGIRQGDPISP